VNKKFWAEKKVLITGHTGFKGSWLSLWMQSLSAKVIGISLDPPTNPNLFTEAHVAENMVSIIQDIRDLKSIREVFSRYHPEIVFHMAAQPLVLYSYEHPVETYSTNVMGTLNILEAIRAINSVKSAVIITSDKCYENIEKDKGYKETEPMGGRDPYSSSKGAAELLISSYRRSYFSDINQSNKVSIASARAGNVIGGGDWAENRLIPDIITAIDNEIKINIRNPKSIRPWQHVIEPLAGYIILAESLYNQGSNFAEGWNFGPNLENNKPVEWILEYIKNKLQLEEFWNIDNLNYPHEASYLKLDSRKANKRLGWSPKWTLESSIDKVLEWNNSYNQGMDPKEISLNQISEYS